MNQQFPKGKPFKETCVFYPEDFRLRVASDIVDKEPQPKREEEVQNTRVRKKVKQVSGEGLWEVIE